VPSRAGNASFSPDERQREIAAIPEHAGSGEPNSPPATSVTGIIAFESVCKFVLVEFDNHRSTVRTGVGVLTVIERFEQFDYRPLRERRITGDGRVTR
jgi:hypothetical protein